MEDTPEFKHGLSKKVEQLEQQSAENYRLFMLAKDQRNKAEDQVRDLKQKTESDRELNRQLANHNADLTEKLAAAEAKIKELEQIIIEASDYSKGHAHAGLDMFSGTEFRKYAEALKQLKESK